MTFNCVMVKAGDGEPNKAGGKFILVAVSLQLLLTASVSDKLLMVRVNDK
jgi:hypothetical protein